MCSLRLDWETFEDPHCEICRVYVQDVVEVAAHYITEVFVMWDADKLFLFGVNNNCAPYEHRACFYILDTDYFFAFGHKKAKLRNLYQTLQM